MAVTDAPDASSADRRRFFRRLRFWVWIQERIQPTDLQITLFWSGIIGFSGALCSIAFRLATSFVHKILTGSSAPGLVESFAQLSASWRVVIPAFGGLLAGAVLQFGTRWRGGVTTADYMEAVVLGDGRISTRRSLVKCLSAMFTIASGGSIGREGPLVQLSSLVASAAGRWRHWSTPRLRLLVGCGAAAGIASAYNAPIAGALFVAEIVLGSVAMEIFGPLVFSSVIATLTVRGFIGSEPIYDIPHFQLNSNWEILPYLLLGLFAGAVAPWFLRLLRASERLARSSSGPGFSKNAGRRIDCRHARRLPSGGLRQWLQHREHDSGREPDLADRGRDFDFQGARDCRDLRLGRGRRSLHANALCRSESRLFVWNCGRPCRRSA